MPKGQVRKDGRLSNMQIAEDRGVWCCKWTGQLMTSVTNLMTSCLNTVIKSFMLKGQFFCALWLSPCYLPRRTNNLTHFDRMSFVLGSIFSFTSSSKNLFFEDFYPVFIRQCYSPFKCFSLSSKTSLLACHPCFSFNLKIQSVSGIPSLSHTGTVS